jgi:hypothetical protein
MSHKFSIVIEMKGDKPVASAYLKVNAQEAIAHFLRLRTEEKEAYLFQHPVADRRSKSAAQVVATLGLRDDNGKVPDSEPVADNRPKTIINPEAAKKAAEKLKAARKQKTDGFSPDVAIDIE